MSLIEQLAEPKGPQPKAAEPENTNKLMEGGDWVDVVPYNAYNDPMSAHFLHWMWKKLQDDGLIELYYPDAGTDEKYFPTFVRMFSSDSTKVILVVLKDDKGEVKDVIGFSTWEPMKFGPSTVGHCGFVFRKDYWQRRTSIEAGHRILRFWFEEAEPRLDVALGLIARLNTLAQRYVRALGWVESGWLHNGQQYKGETCDAVIWQYTRSMFEEHKGA